MRNFREKKNASIYNNLMDLKICRAGCERIRTGREGVTSMRT